MRPRIGRLLAALNGMLAVGVGAMGAHAVTAPQAKAWIATGATYGIAHALACLWAERENEGGLTLLWGVGALLFAGSLYALGLGAPREVAALAPVGGLSMLVGWASLLVSVLRRSKPRE